MSGNNGNGRMNGKAPGGPTGGGAGTKQIRGKLGSLKSAAKAGALAGDKLDAAIAFAQCVVDGGDLTSYREKLRACDFIAYVNRSGCTAEVDLDKIHRLDTGGVTERHEYVVGLPEVR